MSETMGTKAASELWGYPQSTIARWCRENLIDGADHDGPGSPWHIPIDAVPPKNRNAKQMK